jgi:hypothetical protein
MKGSTLYNTVYWIAGTLFEVETTTAAANVDRIKLVDLAVKVRHAILKSANPGGITRSLEAIHQIYLFIYLFIYFIFVVLFGVSDLARFS